MFIPKSKVPKDQKLTYGEIVCEMKQEKEEKKRIRLTVGENLLDFTENLISPTAPVTTEKYVFNSVVSAPGDRYLLVDIKYLYLNNILPDPYFMRGLSTRLRSEELSYRSVRM